MSIPGIHAHGRDLEGDAAVQPDMAFAIGGVLAIFGSVGYIAMNFYSGSPREVYALPLSAATSAIATLGLVVLAIGVARWRIGVPTWVRTLSAAGLIMTAATSWFFATGIVAFAEHTNDKTFDEVGMSGWIMAMSLPKMAMCLVGFVALAVTGWRTNALSRPASVLLVIGALLSLIPPYPPGVVFAAAGLFIASRAVAARRA